MNRINVKNLARSGLLIGLFSLAACASMSGDTFVKEQDPHATLLAVQAPQVTAEIYPAFITRVDGHSIPQQNRRTFYLEPGEHVIALKPDREAIQEYEDNFGRNFEVPRIFFERDVRVTLEEGKSYRFGVKITKYNYAEWEPFVTEITE